MSTLSKEVALKIVDQNGFYHEEDPLAYKVFRYTNDWQTEAYAVVYNEAAWLSAESSPSMTDIRVLWSKGDLSMHSLVKQARQNIVSRCAADGCMPESWNEHNDLNRAIIRAMKRERGHAWLGLINRYERDADRPWLWESNAVVVLNFEAAFVLPIRCPEVERLIRDRHCSPYRGTGHDGKALDKIFNAIQAAGGIHLTWT